MVPISNLGARNRIIMQYCFQNRIPVYMIINGLQSLSFWNDGKDSDWVNCYSQSIKEDYFSNAPNALPLGDPRMDVYFNLPRREINKEYPVILIGTSGYNSLDLNSYLSIEFEFIYNVLQVLNDIFHSGKKFTIIIKVRTNGYVERYKQFLKEYFPKLQAIVEQNHDFASLLIKSDLYISFYSQTILEAAALGIPTIYFKNDTQTLFRPFDGNSELVTVSDSLKLSEMISLFFEGNGEFSLFQQKEILEKYIGPLDGKNLERNLDFINLLVNNKSIPMVN
jgi:hypothetical protein